MSKIKDQSLAGPQILQDPMPIKKGIDVEKKGSAYQIHLQADGIKAHGLGDLKINYLRATRQGLLYRWTEQSILPISTGGGF